MKKINHTFLGLTLLILFCFFIIRCGASINYAKIDYAEIEKNSAIKMIVQSAHSDVVNSVSFSPDGKYAISGSKDKTLKLWDIKSGKEIRTFKGHSEAVTSVSFSPNGRYFISGSGHPFKKKTPGKIKLWDIKSEKAIKTFTGHSKRVSIVSFSPDGKYALSGSWDNTFKLWDIQSGKEIRTFTGQKNITSVNFSPNGKYFFSTGGSYENPKLWDIQSGREIQILPYKEKRLGWWRTRYLKSVSFSQDSKYILLRSRSSTRNKYDRVILFDIQKEKEGDLQNVKDIRNFKYCNIGKRSFSQNGKYTLMIGGKKNQITLFYTKSWMTKHKLPAFRTFGRPYRNTSISFSANGKYILSGRSDGILKLWDIKIGKEIKAFAEQSGKVRNVSFSPNGKYALSGSFKHLKLWDIKSLKAIRTFKGVTDSVFSPNSKYILSGSRKYLELWDIKSGKAIRTFKIRKVDVMSFSPNGKYALTASGGGFTMFGQMPATITLCDIKSGKARRLAKIDDTVTSLSFSPDSKYALAGSQGRILILWNIKSGKKIRTFRGHAGWVYSVTFSPDGKYALSGGSSQPKLFKPGEMKLWDIKSGKAIRTFTGHSRLITSVSFSPDGKYALSGSKDNTIILWDIESGNKIKTFTGHSFPVNNVSFSPNGKHVLSGSDDGTMKIWNIKTGDHVSLLSDKEKWLIYTSDGYFDSSKNGGELLAMVKGLSVWGIDQFAIRNNRPDIILKRMGFGSPELINHYYYQFKKRLRKLGFNENDLSSELHVPEAKVLNTKQKGKFVELQIALQDSKYDLKRYNIYVNDVPIFGAYGKKISGNSVSKTEKIELTSGYNKIEISCINVKGVESYRALTSVNYDKKIKGNLYYLGFGASIYKNSKINLKYAHKDAKDLAKLFSKMKGQFKKVYTKTYLNEEVTVKNIKKAKAFLKNAKVDDTFVLFIAGHGVHDQDKETTYYFLTYNTDLTNLSGTAANYELIEMLLQGIAPRRKLFLIDTCESGEVDDSVQDRYYAMAGQRGFKARTSRGIFVISRVNKNQSQKRRRRNYLFQKDRFIYNDLLRRSGAIVFSSSKGGEFSYESDKIKNGFFTKEIINGLSKGKADKNRDGMISTDELRSYVSKRVSKRSKGLQHPVVDRDNIHQKFGFPVVR